ncbi:hypothetical protein PENSTE_c012G07471 [Penicillium steckii]|uniref:Uncharacterized protein n=1 Tax=Penicillium steckii TaxID=303698 RepID=A0A1V6T4B1_9EURO|nr:hypothetical protein PENSTE_c012G07471 [Penicillium steckii]
MRARPRRALFQLIIFTFILGTIIYLNRPQSKAKYFPWAKIRYQTRATTTPSQIGICPDLSTSKKPALVVSHVKSDGIPSWLDKLTDKYTLCIYDVDNSDSDNDNHAGSHNEKSSSSHLAVPANRGHEAMAYLTFLIDNYKNIPSSGAVFIHGSRWAWHNDAPDYDNAALLRDLDISAALAPLGYHNLRCDWSAGTCSSKVPAQGSLEMRLQSAVAPWSARAASDMALSGALASIFGGVEANAWKQAILGRNDAVRAQCCAQFVVSRERVWQHTREEYIALRQWLLDGSLRGEANSRSGVSSRRDQDGVVAPVDDKVAGRILSYLWHILFAEIGSDGLIGLESLNKAACPSAEECYCRLYGRCKLQCPNSGSCRGQYSIPKYYKLPDDWADTHE